MLKLQESQVSAINEQINTNATGVQIFNNPQFGEVRITEIGGKTYFVGIDVTRALGYKNANDAVTRHCRGGGGGA
jgi:prophage antirepressor-like protein